MATKLKLGTFVTAASGTANITLTTFGFTPRANRSVIFFWGALCTADATVTEDAGLCVGAACSTTEQGCTAVEGRDVNQGGPSSEASVLRTDAAYTTIVNNVLSGRFKILSYDADGVTLQVTAAFSAARKVHFCCIEADEITNCTVVSKAIAAADNTAESITGLTFQPTWAICLHAGESVIALSTKTGSSGFGIGAYDGTRQNGSAISGNGNTTGASCRAITRTDRVATFPRFDSSTERTNLEATAFTSDGLTYTVHRSAGSAAHMTVWILGTGTIPFRADSFQDQSATGNFSGPSPSATDFAAGFLMGYSPMSTATTQTASSALQRMSVGGAISASAQRAVWMEIPTTVQDTASYSDESLWMVSRIRSATDTFPLEASIAFVGWGSPITLNQVDAEAAQKLIPCFMFGSKSGLPPFQDQARVRRRVHLQR